MTRQMLSFTAIYKFIFIISHWSNIARVTASGNEVAIELPSNVDAVLVSLDKGFDAEEMEDLDSLEKRFETLHSRYESHISALQNHGENYVKNIKELDHLKNVNQELKSKMQELTERTHELNGRVHRFNAQQLQKLALRLQAVYALEQRDRSEPKSDIIKESSYVAELHGPSLEDYVTSDELDGTWESIFDATQPWEQKLENYVREIAEDVVVQKFNPTRRQHEKFLMQYRNETNSINEEPSCISKKQLKPMILESIHPSYLANYQDHIPGAQIIHSKSYTSPTYASTSASLILSLIGQSHTQIQNDNTNLGHCWPMLMSKEDQGGKITFHFTEPIYVHAVAIHHVSPKILTKEQRKKGTGSAPRFFHVKAYAPCKFDQNQSIQDCEEGFDEDDSWILVNDEYIWGGGVVQYFKVGIDTNSQDNLFDTLSILTDDQMNLNNDMEDSDAGFSGSSGSCSMPPASVLESDNFVPSCDSDEDNTETDNRPVQAITLVIEENSGHEDFTCLYRFQVFGEKV